MKLSRSLLPNGLVPHTSADCGRLPLNRQKRCSLTPGHLLIGSSMMATPEPNLDVTKPSLLTRWQQISLLKQQFWNMWSRDYLLSLQQRSKWFTESRNIVEGQLVVVHKDNAPSQQWLLARITKCIPGRDGKVRVVELQTQNGSSCRPIHKIAILPHQDIWTLTLHRAEYVGGD